MTNISSRIKQIIVEDFRGHTYVSTENLEINDHSIVFDHWIDLLIKNFEFFPTDSYIESHKADWIRGRVKQQVTISFDNLEFDEHAFTICLEPVLIEINECSDDSLLSIYNRAKKDQIYDEFCNGLDIDANNISVKIEFY